MLETTWCDFGEYWALCRLVELGESNGTGAQIAVPLIWGALYNNFGTSYGIGMKDYVAIGVSKWSSFILDN